MTEESGAKPTARSEEEMFSDEFIELCRGLALPREWQQGDWVHQDDGSGDRWIIRVLGSWVEDANHSSLVGPFFPHRKPTWLPREGDILDLLEAEGYTSVSIGWIGQMDGRWVSAIGRRQPAEPTPRLGEGPNRLTALLRLLIAVRGVTSGDPQESPKEEA